MSIDVTTTNQTRPITGRFVLFAMLAFFGVIIIVNVIMMSFALNTDNGLVVRNSYVASQDFNRNTAEARAQDALGWSMQASLEGGELVVRLADEAGGSLDGMTVTAKVGRPVTDRDDHTVLLSPAGDFYRSPVSVSGGAWQADIQAVNTDGETYRRVWRFDVEPGE